MGAFLGKLFIDPTTLPGGANCGGNHSIYEETQGHHTTLDDPLGCSQCE
jgi:hypothetical protein